MLSVCVCVCLFVVPMNVLNLPFSSDKKCKINNLSLQPVAKFAAATSPAKNVID